MAHPRSRLIVPLAVAVLLLMGLSQAGAAGAEDLTRKKQQVDAKVDDAHGEVLAFNKRVAKATQQVIDARAQQPGAQRNYEQAVQNQQVARAESDQARASLEKVTARLLSEERRLSRVEDSAAELETRMGDFARRAYQMGPYADLEMLLEARDPSEFTRRLEAIRTVSKAGNDSLSDLALKRAALSSSQEHLDALRAQAAKEQRVAKEKLQVADQAAEGAAAAKRIVDSLVEQEEAALRIAKENRGQIKAQYDQLAAEQARIQAEIVAAAKSLSKQTGVKTGNGHGQWMFPVAGASIGSEAGWRFHPILKYTRCHAGADISAPTGTPIVAVADGVVVSAGGNGGYGNYTVIAHGSDVTSAYAHQSVIGVSAGQRVKQGQVIGFVGSTGLSTGAHLHFEARVAGAPWDPRGWFGTGPKVPVCV